LFEKIKGVMRQGSIFIGDTPKFDPHEGDHHHHQHAHEFHSVQELANLLKKVFVQVEVYETVHPERITLYWKVVL
jgi:hypothetical protein